MNVEVFLGQWQSWAEKCPGADTFTELLCVFYSQSKRMETMHHFCFICGEVTSQKQTFTAMVRKADHLEFDLDKSWAPHDHWRRTDAHVLTCIKSIPVAEQEKNNVAFAGVMMWCESPRCNLYSQKDKWTVKTLTCNVIMYKPTLTFMVCFWLNCMKWHKMKQDVCMKQRLAKWSTPLYSHTAVYLPGCWPLCCRWTVGLLAASQSGFSRSLWTVPSHRTSWSSRSSPWGPGGPGHPETQPHFIYLVV